MTAKTKKTSKPRKRKPAARNECDVVEEVPAACSKCHYTEREQKECVKKRWIKGVGKDGRPYNQIVWKYSTCKNCGNRYRSMSRLMVFDPEVSDTDT